MREGIRVRAPRRGKDGQPAKTPHMLSISSSSLGSAEAEKCRCPRRRGTFSRCKAEGDRENRAIMLRQLVFVAEHTLIAVATRGFAAPASAVQEVLLLQFIPMPALCSSCTVFGVEFAC